MGDKKDNLKNRCDIVIVTYNSRNEIENCLSSILKYDRDNLGTIIIVDNASKDDTIAKIEKFKKTFQRLILITNSENKGYSFANNQGLQQCRSEYVLFLNPDTEFCQPTLRNFIEMLENNPKIGLIGPKIRNADGVINRGYGGEMTLCSLITETVFGGKCKSILLNLLPVAKKPAKVGWISGAFLFGRRKLIAHIQGFDEGMFMYMEDVELCMRVRREGYEVIYDPTVELIHHGGKSQKQNIKQALIQNIRSRIYFSDKYFSQFSRLFFKLFLFFYLPLRSLLHFLFCWKSEEHHLKKQAYWQAFLHLMTKGGKENS